MSLRPCKVPEDGDSPGRPPASLSCPWCRPVPSRARLGLLKPQGAAGECRSPACPAGAGRRGSEPGGGAEAGGSGRHLGPGPLWGAKAGGGRFDAPRIDGAGYLRPERRLCLRRGEPAVGSSWGNIEPVPTKLPGVPLPHPAARCRLCGA